MFLIKRSHPRFQGRKHTNLTRFGSIQLAPGTGAGSYASVSYTLAEMQGLKALGYDSVRFTFKPDPMLAAIIANDQAKLTILIGQLLAVGDLCMQAGLLVVFDMHFSGSSVLRPEIVLGSSDPAAPYFVAYKAACIALAQAIYARYLPETVALDLFNEPYAISDAYWASVLQPNVFAAVRAVAPQLTLIVRGGSFDAAFTLPFLRVQDYDWNTLYSVHFYDFSEFTYSASEEQVGTPLKYYSQIDYPPDGISPAAAIARASANIAADTSLSADQQQALAAAAASRLTNYYTTFTRAALFRSMATIDAWCLGNGIDLSSIYGGEIGVYQDAGSTNSVTPAARAAWFSDVTGNFNRKGIRWGTWQAEIPGHSNHAFYVQEPTSGLGSVANPTNVSALMKASLGFA
jgi:hypothetical protein